MSVEFLPSDEPDDGPDELPRQRDRLPRRIWWLVAVLLAAGTTAWALTRPSPAPAPQVATPQAPTRMDPACRGVPDCAVRGGVSPSIDRLARTYLPRGVTLHVHTVVAVSSLTHENLLVERDIDAVVDSVSVLIRVQRAGSGTQQIVVDPPGVSSLLLHEVNSGFVVRLQYLAPDTVPPMVARLQALLRDPRLAAS